jgi:hypothetical protein
MRRYKVLLPLVLHDENGSYKQGDIFEKDMPAVEEAENLASGLLELQPLEYKVVGESNVHGANPGETFELALPRGQEELLIAGGHIKPIEPKPAPKPKRKAKEAK